MRPHSDLVGDGSATDGLRRNRIEKRDLPPMFSHAILRRSSPVQVVKHMRACEDEHVTDGP